MPAASSLRLTTPELSGLCGKPHTGMCTSGVGSSQATWVVGGRGGFGRLFLAQAYHSAAVRARKRKRTAMKLTRRQFKQLAAGAVALPAVSQVARAQTPSAVATLSPTGKLRVAPIASNPVLVTRGADGTRKSRDRRLGHRARCARSGPRRAPRFQRNIHGSGQRLCSAPGERHRPAQRKSTVQA
jgi:hypothetical protein